jgi:hypothetical protein
MMHFECTVSQNYAKQKIFCSPPSCFYDIFRDDSNSFQPKAGGQGEPTNSPV